MIYRRIARRYAAALFGAAREQGIAEQVEADLRAAHAGIAADPRLHAALAHPEIPAARKRDFLQRAFAGLTPLALTFLSLLVRRRRQAYLADIAEEYRDMADEARGLVRARVVSAVDMTEEQRTRLRRALERRTGKRVEMSAAVDSSLLAGLVVTIAEQKVVDASARGRLEKMRALLAGARFRGLGRGGP
jgi:F-type H+-transporting ATPase subunit delta